MRGCAEQHERGGLDWRAITRHVGAFDFFEERDLFEWRARLAAVPARPAETDPAGLAEVEGEIGVIFPLVEFLCFEAGLALA